MDTMTETRLTLQDVRAMRNADALCFDHTGVGEGQIRAIRRAEESSSGFEETHTVRVALSTVDNYGRDVGPVTAFHMTMSARYDDVSQTLTRAMRAGSLVRLMWTRNNASPVLDNVGIVRDELRVRVQSPDGKRTDTYLVAVSVGLDNSARMIRPATGANR